MTDRFVAYVVVDYREFCEILDFVEENGIINKIGVDLFRENCKIPTLMRDLNTESLFERFGLEAGRVCFMTFNDCVDRDENLTNEPDRELVAA